MKECTSELLKNFYCKVNLFEAMPTPEKQLSKDLVGPASEITVKVEGYILDSGL